VGERMASLVHGGDRRGEDFKSPRGPLKPAVTMARATDTVSDFLHRRDTGQGGESA